MKHPQLKTVTITFLLFLSVQIGFSQIFKLGKVSKQELEEKYYPSDSSAHAAILFEDRRTFFNYNQGTGFEQVTEVQERIKIYDEEGYKWATKMISYYTPEDNENEKVKI